MDYSLQRHCFIQLILLLISVKDAYGYYYPPWYWYGHPWHPWITQPAGSDFWMIGIIVGIVIGALAVILILLVCGLNIGRIHIRPRYSWYRNSTSGGRRSQDPDETAPAGAVSSGSSIFTVREGHHRRRIEPQYGETSRRSAQHHSESSRHSDGQRRRHTQEPPRYKRSTFTAPGIEY